MTDAEKQAARVKEILNEFCEMARQSNTKIALLTVPLRKSKRAESTIQCEEPSRIIAIDYLEGFHLV